MADANFEIPGKYLSVNPGNEMYYYGGGFVEGGWPDKASAVAAIPVVLRPGRTVGIIEDIEGVNTLVEYIWHPDNLGDGDLVLKTSGGDVFTDIDNNFTAGQTITGGLTIIGAPITSDLTPTEIDAADPNTVPTKEWVEEQVGGSFATEAFEVILSNGKTLGKYLNGETVPAFTDPAVMLRNIGQEAIAPSWQQPSASLSGVPATNTPIYEIGKVLAIALTASLNPGESGGVDSYEIYRESTVISNTNTATSNITLTSSNIAHSAVITYFAGTGSKFDGLGNEYPNPIGAGSKTSNTLNYKGYMKLFYESVASKISDPAGVRTMPFLWKHQVGGKFSLNTGKVNKIFQFWLDNSSTVQEVLDKNTNATITTSYISEPMTIADGGSGTIAGKLYTMTIAVVYQESHEHIITFS